MTMKILSLTAENVKKLSVVEITPQGNLVQITGKNGQGKSSVLDAIWWALAGTSNIQSAPIRKGKDEARITLDLGDIIVKRTFKQIAAKEGEPPAKGYTTSIIVESADGARYQKPQQMLDGLLGSLAFDPLAFANMECKEQFETLKRFVPGVDFAAIEKANAADFEARTTANRRAKEAKAQAAGILVPDGTPTEPIDESALVTALENAGVVNSDIVKRKGARDSAAVEISGLKSRAKQSADEAARLRKQAEDADAATKAALTKAEELEAKLAAAPPLPEPVDTSAIKLTIEAARATNKHVSALARRGEFEKVAEQQEAISDNLTEAMKKREADKRKAIASAALPIPGIEFGDGELLMNGVPFDQASDAERLRASISIAMAMNPKLRIVRVRDGSLLDEDGITLLAEMADKADCQVWLERVDSSGKIGFVLEDGHLKAAAQAEMQAAE